MSDDRQLDETQDDETPDVEIRVAYCSACDREVRLQVPAATETDEATTAGEASHLRGICLDVGTDCTGAFCPFGDQPPAEGS